ncbi:hypothetical protein ABBQ32_14225 [Trebouxia sp. C0010 RCD-2024]
MRLPSQQRADAGRQCQRAVVCGEQMWAECVQQPLAASTTSCRLVECQFNWCLVLEKQPIQHATAIPSRTYPFSSDQGSQTGLGSTSTRLSDRPGTLSAVVSFDVSFCCMLVSGCSLAADGMYRCGGCSCVLERHNDLAVLAVYCVAMV